jgi:uncharacterized protein YrrD
MQRVTDVVGKPIVSAENGERVGKVSDVLLDEESRHVIGLVVAGGVLASEQVVPFSEVQTLGRDAVLVRTSGGVIGRKAWRQQSVSASRSSRLENRPIFTDAGRALGRVRNVQVDETTGDVQGFEVTGRAFEGVLPRQSADATAVVGPDAIIVPESLAPARGGRG